LVNLVKISHSYGSPRRIGLQKIIERKESTQLRNGTGGGRSRRCNLAGVRRKIPQSIYGTKVGSSILQAGQQIFDFEADEGH